MNEEMPLVHHSALCLLHFFCYTVRQDKQAREQGVRLQWRKRNRRCRTRFLTGRGSSTRASSSGAGSAPTTAFPSRHSPATSSAKPKRSGSGSRTSGYANRKSRDGGRGGGGREERADNKPEKPVTGEGGQETEKEKGFLSFPFSLFPRHGFKSICP